MKQPERLEVVLRDLLTRLGLPDPLLVDALVAEWDDLAGDPWAQRSQPAYLRDGELVVTVSEPALVAMLRYAIGDLLHRLDARLGQGVVTSIRVVALR
ncbi:MAG: DciA family protein [Acidimicrobiia bacterium]